MHPTKIPMTTCNGKLNGSKKKRPKMNGRATLKYFTIQRRARRNSCLKCLFGVGNFKENSEDT